MAKQDDNMLLYLGLGALVFLYLRNRNAMPGSTTGHVTPGRITPGTGQIAAVYHIGDMIRLPYGATPPLLASNLQWYNPPTGAQSLEQLWVVEAKGTTHAPIDPRDVLGTSGGGIFEDTNPRPVRDYPPAFSTAGGDIF